MNNWKQALSSIWNKFLKLTGGTLAGDLNMNGNEVTLDADADTSVSSSADDVINYKIGGVGLGVMNSTGFTYGANMTLGGANKLQFQSRSKIGSSADGKVNLTDNAGTGFIGLTLGPEDTTGARLQKTGTGLNCVNGDNTLYTDFHCDQVFVETSLGVYGKSYIGASADGYLEMYNNAGTNFSGIRLGGTAATFPMITRSGTGIAVRKADDSGYGSIAGDYVTAASQFVFLSKSKIGSGSDGYVDLYNDALSGFTGLRFGGLTSSFPMLKRNSAQIQFRLADDSAFCAIQAGVVYGTVLSLTTTGFPAIYGVSASPEGVTTAPVGSLALNNGGTSGSTLYTKVSGTGNTGWLPIRHTDQLMINADDLTGTDVHRIVVAEGAVLEKAYSVLEGSALATGDATLTLSINGTPVTGGVITITEAGSAIGDVDSCAPSAANTVSAGDVIEVTVGGSNTSPNATAKVVFLLRAT